MSNKQSSVDFLIEQFNLLFLWQDGIPGELHDVYIKAKAMHKEEIMQAYSDGLGNGIAYADGQARNTVLDELKYYDEIFNSNV